MRKHNYFKDTCDSCIGKAVARGLKQIVCTRCGKKTMINCLSKFHVCSDCRTEVECHMCGGLIDEKV